MASPPPGPAAGQGGAHGRVLRCRSRGVGAPDRPHHRQEGRREVRAIADLPARGGMAPGSRGEGQGQGVGRGFRGAGGLPLRCARLPPQLHPSIADVGHAAPSPVRRAFVYGGTRSRPAPVCLAFDQHQETSPTVTPCAHNAPASTHAAAFHHPPSQHAPRCCSALTPRSPAAPVPSSRAPTPLGLTPPPSCLPDPPPACSGTRSCRCGLGRWAACARLPRRATRLRPRAWCARRARARRTTRGGWRR